MSPRTPSSEGWSATSRFSSFVNKSPEGEERFLHFSKSGKPFEVSKGKTVRSGLLRRALRAKKLESVMKEGIREGSIEGKLLEERDVRGAISRRQALKIKSGLFKDVSLPIQAEQKRLAKRYGVDKSPAVQDKTMAKLFRNPETIWDDLEKLRKLNSQLHTLEQMFPFSDDIVDMRLGLHECFRQILGSAALERALDVEIEKEGAPIIFCELREKMQIWEALDGLQNAHVFHIDGQERLFDPELLFNSIPEVKGEVLSLQDSPHMSEDRRRALDDFLEQLDAVS